MAAVIDSPVIRELAAILEHIDRFPHPGESDFEKCRGFRKDNTGRCRIRVNQKQNRIMSLLSQFQSMTTCVDTKGLYDKMESFITLTHCEKYHRGDALEAFGRWKSQRKAATSRSRPVTPSRSVTPHNDSLELDSDVSSLPCSSPELSSTENDESILDSRIEEQMKKLKIACAAQDTTTTSSRIAGDDIEQKIDRVQFEKLGDVLFPIEGKDYHHRSINQAIKKPRPNSQTGILYVLEHTEIPGLFKIGRSRESVEERHRKNCFRAETTVAHTSSGPFLGHARAERIALTILQHKKLLIARCIHCETAHIEWVLATKNEVLSVVKLAERWLRMPTYAFQDGEYRLTPTAEGIHNELFHFSMDKMSNLMDQVYGSDDAPRVFPDSTTPTSSTRRSRMAAERAVPRLVVDEVLDIPPPQGYNTRAKSPAARRGGKENHLLMETEEVFEVHRRRSRESTPERDGNYILTTELEIKKTIRTRVSTSKLGVSDVSKPGVFGTKEGKERRTKGKVEEV
ncbi:hypothetical protein ACQKWADRAFT_301885 [Trichoderma austrokoningii]